MCYSINTNSWPMQRIFRNIQYRDCSTNTCFVWVKPSDLDRLTGALTILCLDATSAFVKNVDAVPIEEAILSSPCDHISQSRKYKCDNAHVRPYDATLLISALSGFPACQSLTGITLFVHLLHFEKVWPQTCLHIGHRPLKDVNCSRLHSLILQKI